MDSRLFRAAQRQVLASLVVLGARRPFSRLCRQNWNAAHVVAAHWLAIGLNSARAFKRQLISPLRCLGDQSFRGPMLRRVWFVGVLELHQQLETVRPHQLALGEIDHAVHCTGVAFDDKCVVGQDQTHERNGWWIQIRQQVTVRAEVTAHIQQLIELLQGPLRPLAQETLCLCQARDCLVVQRADDGHHAVEVVHFAQLLLGC